MVTYAILVVDELTEFTYVIIINIDRTDKTCVKNKIGGNPVTQRMKTGQRSSLRCGELGREVQAAGLPKFLLWKSLSLKTICG